ncbi:MAG: fructose-6-phosphate aldolase [Bacillota bacterium]|jgi:transaldolase|nr:fructose-6-phosphate aldolase [Candidatus Fermentithermobacillaceae bacterium]HAF67250.1 fructose-6-phosphate aldolase [Clostridiales bacterium UBA9857]HOA70236.1 fructose-6-phosphate aldolase [Bacillota bacterium]HOP71018.1 fructose-6-phosphate aldolase [Bacillota bacterium]HPT35309.1 fructose-6-phosphate aldolase [Bacillota bacterium]
MQLFLDTANIDEIREALSWGVISGVTTNPSLVAKEGRDFKTLVKQICEMVPGPVSAEVLSLDFEGMVEEARDLASIAPNVVIKIPMTKDGLKAVKVLSQEGIKTNVTLVFSATQGLLAALAGATYVSPFIGRLDDISNEGMNVVEDLVVLVENYNLPTKVIAASIRHPMHVLEAARVACHIATVPFKVLEAMLNHPLTDIGIKRFLDDWAKLQAGK